MEMGVGRDGMSVMCDIFNMPPPCHPNVWKHHVTALYEAHKKAVSGQLQEATDKVFSRHSDNESGVGEIAVSYDGTWSKRVYTANFGIGFVISADTGEVLDYDFESKICRECQIAKKDLGEDSPEFDIWFGGHQEQCTQTHTCSSGSMECSIAKKIWGRANVKPGKLTAQHQKEQISIMQQAKMAVLYHSCELIDDKERHKFCPSGPDSWCSHKREGKFQRKDHHLDAVFLEFLVPEFKRVSHYSLLLRCLPGYSQNVNESLNSLVWNHALKHRFKGPRFIEIAAMSAVLAFNCGAASRQDVMKAANIPGGEFTLEGCKKMKCDKDEALCKEGKVEEKGKKEENQRSQACSKPIERLLADNDSEDSDSEESDDAPLAHFISKRQ
ncbi:Hypothetical predicted protein [Paramuricea clavata]|uniref:Mutator-like transposase domain-containing protein n=1 Tax=Paramuricea clavata TaxID=317549 RepID=A0A7D9EEV6_PARCT|nr:Hypothetical predicted protein [Paramuricea clavata]